MSKKPHNYKWTEQAIAEGIAGVMYKLGITHMPTNREVAETMGNDALKQAIVRSGGFDVWAIKLGLERPKMKTVMCCDCGKEIYTVICNQNKLRCEECRKAHKAKTQQERYAALEMTKQMDFDTDLIIVRSMQGRRKQSAAAVARDIGRDKRRVLERVKMLKDTGKWERIWRYLQSMDGDGLYRTAIC